MDKLYLVTQKGCDSCGDALEIFKGEIDAGNIIHKECDYDTDDGRKICKILDNLPVGGDAVPSLILIREEGGEITACEVDMSTLEIQTCGRPPVWFDD